MSRLPATSACRFGCAAQPNKKKTESEGPARNPDPLSPPVGPGQHNGEERCGNDRQGEAAGEAIKLADAGDPGEFCQEGAGSGDAEPAGGKPRPAGSEGLADQFAMAAPGKNPEPHREFLHQVEYRDQNYLQQQQAIAPLDPALAGGDDAANIGVRQHDDDAGTEHSEEASCGSR